jgi:hypothetical protein
MSELNETTIRRFKVLAGLNQKSKDSRLLEQFEPAPMPDVPLTPGTFPDPAPMPEPTPAPDVDPAPMPEVEPTPLDLTPGTFPEPTEEVVTEDEEPLEEYYEEGMNPLRTMAENREKIVDKIADAMLKYLSDK